MKRWLFQATDNSPLIIFRIIFGFLVLCESWGAIATGWVRRVLIEPQFTFHFIGLDFLQPLPGKGMYVYFVLMGICGIGIMLGYFYRLSSILFAVFWAGVYLMQKSAYNNHYYLLWLLAIIMATLPAHKDLSIDSKKGRVSKSQWMPNWVWFLIVGQLLLVYTFAAIAKLYPDWLDGSVAKNLMSNKYNLPIIGDLLQQSWAHQIITWFGILFDLLIIPALLWKPTRKIAFGLALFFHLYNSIILQIGIFPYLALGFTVFFFPRDNIRKWFYPKQEKVQNTIASQYADSSLIKTFVFTWLLIQLMLPLRHWFIDGNVLYTEEGHRLSWRMMLRSKSGYNRFFIQKEGETKKQLISLEEYLTPKQIRSMTGKPDIIWQFAQQLKSLHAKKGQNIKVFVKNKTTVNNKTTFQLIDPTLDLTSVSWNYFGHNDWVLEPSLNLNQ